ncbi:uncharacterized protein LOC142353309 [Convolutriloba macropyga]|uniref:uncharacterized protein LOC142353309 n=1 Tax=Convolutriloba macropyga TaxID=536237 RepID=UPI003F520803
MCMGSSLTFLASWTPYATLGFFQVFGFSPGPSWWVMASCSAKCCVVFNAFLFWFSTKHLMVRSVAVVSSHQTTGGSNPTTSNHAIGTSNLHIANRHPTSQPAVPMTLPFPSKNNHINHSSHIISAEQQIDHHAQTELNNLNEEHKQNNNNVSDEKEDQTDPPEILHTTSV